MPAPEPKTEEDLFYPDIYTSQKGVRSIKFGYDVHQPRVWRRVIASVMNDEVRRELLALCAQLEKNT